MTLHRIKRILRLATIVVPALIISDLSGGAFAQTISVSDAYQLEGTGISSTEQDFLFFIDIFGTIESPITLIWRTRDIDARANSDYEVLPQGEMILMPGDEYLTGDNRRRITVKVFNDEFFEEDETFKLVVATVSNLARISNAGGVATGHILNEDGTRVSIGSFKDFDNTILIGLEFDPPLRFDISTDQSEWITLEIPIIIEKNSDITFVDWSDWNEGGQQVLDIMINRSNLEKEYDRQNLGVESSEPIAIRYVGDQGQIEIEIVGNDYFQPNKAIGNLPAISKGTSCATNTLCTVVLGGSAIDTKSLRLKAEYWTIVSGKAKVIGSIIRGVGLLFAFVAFVAFVVAIIRDNKSRKLSVDNTTAITKDAKENTTTIIKDRKENTAAIIGEVRSLSKKSLHL